MDGVLTFAAAVAAMVSGYLAGLYDQRKWQRKQSRPAAPISPSPSAETGSPQADGKCSCLFPCPIDNCTTCPVSIRGPYHDVDCAMKEG